MSEGRKHQARGSNDNRELRRVVKAMKEDGRLSDISGHDEGGGGGGGRGSFFSC